MPFYKNNLLNHFKDVQPVLERAGVEMKLNVRNFHLEVSAEGKTHTLCPQFIRVENGVAQYTPFLDRQVARFIGWCPYFNRRWDLAIEKLKFKAYVAAHHLPTPEHSVDPDADMQGVLVKKNISSFAEKVEGPFRRSKRRPLKAGEGEFYERFVAGRITKIFYFEDRPVCLEFEKPARVIGDGASTIRQLLAARASRRNREIKLKRIGFYLLFLGKSLDTVLERGAAQEVDFRYGSLFHSPADMESVDLIKTPIPELTPQLNAIGQCLWRGIPEEIRSGTLFTVDAILDADNVLWLIEMNCNPYIHPFMYPVMLEALLKTDGTRSAPFPQRPAALTTETANEILQLAAAQFNSGAIEQALTLWSRVLTSHPTHTTALYYSGLAFMRQGKVADAKRVLDVLANTAPVDNLYFGPAKDLLGSIRGERPSPSSDKSPAVHIDYSGR